MFVVRDADALAQSGMTRDLPGCIIQVQVSIHTASHVVSFVRLEFRVRVS